MTLFLTIFWIILVSFFTLLGALYVRRYDRPDLLIGLYTAFVLFANITASKIVQFDFGFVTLFAPAAVLIFAVTFLFTDIVNERFGRKETIRMIAIALLAQVALVLFSYLLLQANGAPFFEKQEAFEAIFGAVPRIVFASLITFLVSGLLDAYLFDWFRKFTGGKRLWARNIFSSFPAQLLDSALFVIIAFYGVLPVVPLIIGQTAIKWLVGVIDIPFMYAGRRIMRK